MTLAKTEDREEMNSRLVTFAVLSRGICLGFRLRYYFFAAFFFAAFFLPFFFFGG